MKWCIGVSFIILLIFFTNLEPKDNYIYGDEEEHIEEVFDISVSIYGAVNNEGTFNVPSNWKVIDLINFAKAKPSADFSGIDLNKTLKVNGVYKIDFLYAGKININTASFEELDRLPGIGEVSANKIIEYRKVKWFINIEDLKSIINSSTFDKIKDEITV